MSTSKNYDRALQLAQGKVAGLPKAFRLLESARKQGDPRATYALATWYLHGKQSIVARNIKRAVSMLREAADAGHADAAYDLAVCYDKGMGVTLSKKGAARLYLRAALLGERQSAYEVGRCYWYGFGVKQDRTIAKVWLSHAERLGVTK